MTHLSGMIESTDTEKKKSNNQEMLRELKSLEYYYRAWSLSPQERLPILCMALDGLYGVCKTSEVVDKVRETLGEEIPERQLKLLVNL